MHEPVTTVTDFLVALLAWWCAWRLRQSGGEVQLSRRLWAWGLGVQGVAALLGGLVHGFLLGPPAWKMTLLLLAAATTLLVAGLGRAALTAKAAHVLLIVMAGKLVAYTFWIWGRDDFFPALCDQMLSLILLAGLMIVGRRRLRSVIPSLAVGLASLVVGGVIQYLNIGLPPYLNHNDIYHIFGALSIWCLYSAGRVMRDAI